ncbi:MAG: ribulose-phosphate 3-epimerase [Candidatus Levybacteria bacterium]|nr:ribulose-phosphate 3-epimerase [Candidatus Levybacteria bacterium]
MYEIIPSPGTEEKVWSEIEKKIISVKPFVKTIHVDVCDGKFAPNATFADPTLFKKFTKELPSGMRGQMVGDSGLVFEVHLMVEDPVQHLKPWADAGFHRFIGHIEKMPDQVAFVAQAQLLGEVALAIDKQTPLDAIKVNLESLDALLVMDIQAGFSGQRFEEQLLEKVKSARAMNEYLPIEVDGGINDETIAIAASAGANRFVVTSFLFNLDTPESQYKLLQEKLQNLSQKLVE